MNLKYCSSNGDFCFCFNCGNLGLDFGSDRGFFCVVLCCVVLCCVVLCFSFIPPDYWFDGNFKEAAFSSVYFLFTARRHSHTSFNSKSNFCLM